jgi:hypothetical protein
MSSPTLRSRESRVRRALRRHDLLLCKSRGRNPHWPGYGGYMVVDGYTNCVVAGAWPVPYMLSIEGVEEIVEQYAAA